jgi:hypothetical protein
MAILRPGAVRKAPHQALHTLDSYWYDFARARFRWRNPVRSLDRAVLVFTPGKVGSSSVASTLETALAPRRVAHLHYLTKGALLRDEEHFRRRAHAHRGTPRARRFHPYYVWLGGQVRRAMDTAPAGTVWDVVTMVRDPMQRNVSAFFQNLESTDNIWVADLLQHRDADDIAEELVGRFLASYVDGPHPQSDANPLTWFDDELRAVFGIDVFARPFPTERGYATYESSRARVLLVRLEDLSTVGATAFSEFFGVSAAERERRNTAENKTYGDVYTRFQRRLVVPASYLDALYMSTYCRHFYTRRELEGFRRRWIR